MARRHSERFVTLVNDALTRVDEITPEEVQEKINDGDDFILFDVREKEEFERVRIPESEHLGKGIIERDIEERVSGIDREIVLYCGGGYRSALAADNLQKMGFRNVKSMKGGFRSWTEAGLPIDKSAYGDEQ